MAGSHGAPDASCPECVCPSPAAASQSASQKADALDILFLVGLLAFVIALNNVAKARRWPVPPAILTMAVSMAVGALITLLLPEAASRGLRRLDQMAAMQFLTVWLAPIIFAEGYAMRTKQFFDNIVRILAHAFLGTTISAVVVALCVYHLPRYLGQADPLSMGESLAFGALISATDPVTTLAIFKEQRMAENGLGHLYYTVLGESVLNDAVGITLFTMFSGLVVEESNHLGFEEVASIATEFSITFIGSMIIGLCLGCLMPLVLKHAPLASRSPKSTPDGTLAHMEIRASCGILDDDSEGEEELEFNVPEIGVALVLGMIPYLLAEALDLSGIVAIMFAGMVARYYAHHNLTRETRQVFLPTVELVAQLCETYVFIILGLGAFLFQGSYQLPLIGAATLGCLLGRAAHVYPFSFAVNCCSKSEKLRMNEQHMVCFAGLRGAIAFICAFSFPETETSRHRYDIICTTTVIVGGSLLVMGWPTSAMMKWLDIKPREAEAPAAQSLSPSRQLGRPSWGPGQPRLSISSHRRSKSEAPSAAVTEPSNSPDAAPQSPAAPAGWFRRLDITLRRVLMTRSAIIETNEKDFRRRMRTWSDAAPTLLNYPDGSPQVRSAKSWTAAEQQGTSSEELEQPSPRPSGRRPRLGSGGSLGSRGSGVGDALTTPLLLSLDRGRRCSAPAVAPAEHVEHVRWAGV